jgi:hypothetical protein
MVQERTPVDVLFSGPYASILHTWTVLLKGPISSERLLTMVIFTRCARLDMMRAGDRLAFDDRIYSSGSDSAARHLEQVRHHPLRFASVFDVLGIPRQE